jgi:hypothetical protein
MSGGKISGNEATDYGGGVCVISSSSFTMSGGEISGNTTSTYGGGVYFGSSSSSYSFTMSGGEISGNRAATSGGGVYVANTTGRFTKSGTAVIYGDTDTTPGDPENTATSGVGHAAAVVDGRNRNSDALAGATIDTAILGVPGGWD